MASNLERTRIGKSMGRGIGDVGAANLERTGQGGNALEAKKKKRKGMDTRTLTQSTRRLA